MITLILVSFVFISCLSQDAKQQILKTCELAEDCKVTHGDSDGTSNALEQFLMSTFKTSNDAKDIQNKLMEEGIDYNSLLQLDEAYIAQIFRELGIKTWKTGIVINKLRNIGGSAVHKHSASSVVVLTAEQNDYISQLAESRDIINQNIDKLQQAQIDLTESMDEFKKESLKIYQKMIEIVSSNKRKALKSLQNESNNAGKALNVVLDFDQTLYEIINDSKLTMIEKQTAVTQLIESSKKGIRKYEAYLQKDIQFITKLRKSYAREIKADVDSKIGELMNESEYWRPRKNDTLFESFF